MSKTKFKALDFVENIHTGEVEQIERIEYTRMGDEILYMNNSIALTYIGISSRHYISLSPKKIKFNLK